MNITSKNRCIKYLPQFAVFMFFLLMLISSNFISAQTSQQKNKETMQRQMEKLQKEIKEIEVVINSTSQKKKQSIGELQSLLAKIKSREKLINNLQSQLSSIDGDIRTTQSSISQQTKKVGEMKKQYADMIRKAYHNLTLQNEFLFIMSSASFYEAVMRYGVLKRVADFRRIQAKQLQSEIVDLNKKRSSLESQKKEQLQVYSEENKQQQELIREKREQSDMVAKLSSQEKDLRKRFNQKQQAVRNLNKRIEAIIAEEIRLARIKANEARAKSKTPTTPTEKKDVESIPLTPEELALSNDFASNRGKLPWPVSRGHIISGFGKQEHPTLKGVLIENNGVDIKTTAGSEVRAMFDGVVVSVFSLPTTNTCIILKHGEYFTVYSNIDDAKVKSGQKVTTKQPLGKLVDDADDNLTKVHVEIWHGKEKIDPEAWLATN
ncbi:MAG: peptidoglycan DD-metalloendopeptidase family protein [Chitinophagales bacterium]|nr:peptidoglycan DD-metalloendopeptidase family protein [Chitinophagales bacterium]